MFELCGTLVVVLVLIMEVEFSEEYEGRSKMGGFPLVIRSIQ